jgi:all-trans-8'-apo-beta-carotenal 15,15'-oxygenase
VYPRRVMSAVAPASTDGWARNFQNLPQEHGHVPLRIEGTIPTSLQGTLYRNGPGRAGRGADRYAHWFDGDGAVAAVSIRNGAASGAVRMVRTPGLLREEKAGRLLFGGYNTPLKRPLREIFLRDRKNPANTAVMLWQGRLFALCEAGRPFELGPDELQSLGETDLGGVIVHAFSAHPHVSPTRRSILGFGIKVGPRVVVSSYELPERGVARRISQFNLRGPLVLHDFAVAARHMVFSIPPMRAELLPLLLQQKGPLDAMRWERSRGTELVVVPIDTPDETFRITVEAHLAEHFVNAFERDGELFLDFTRYEDHRGLEDAVGGLLDGVLRAPLRSTLSRCIIDLKTHRARFEELSREPCELPRVAPSVDTAPHRFVYVVAWSSAEAARTRFFDALRKHDVETGKTETFVPGEGQFVGEPVFVPRGSGSSSAPEDDGYLLTMVYDAKVDRTHLAVLDAQRLEAGPVGRAWFDHAIPYGFHGVWDPRH